MKHRLIAAAAGLLLLAACAVRQTQISDPTPAVPVPTVPQTETTAPRESIPAETVISSGDDWKLTLVNASHALPEDWDAELTVLSNGKRVDSRIYPALQRMFDDARKAGLDPIVGEGYRTHAEQQQMLDDRIDSYLQEGYTQRAAVQLALEYVAVPGTSEHELGLAVDINSQSGNNEAVYVWLAQNAPAYGFILRYPENKETVTGIAYEPWHYRYVGDVAKKLTAEGLTLEEYLAQSP